MSGWREERRRDQAAVAEQARLDRIAAAEAEAVRERAAVQARREQAEAAQQGARQAARERQAVRDRAGARWKARRAAARAWLSGHVVELLIYPLAAVSAALAVPAMAAWGRELYGSGTGYALPLLTELGMWSFALAVQVAQRGDRPAWALQVGVWAFAGVAFTLNLLHGLSTHGPTSGVVHGVASIAGVVAHQLVVAAPRRTRGQRDAAAVARRLARRQVRARRAAVRRATAVVAADATVHLSVPAGRYTVRRTWTGRPRLVPVPVDPDTPTAGVPDAWDRDLAALLAGRYDPTTGHASTGSTGLAGSGPVATLDPPDPTSTSLDQSTRPVESTSRVDRRPRRRQRSTPTTPSTGRRSIGDLRAALRAAVDAGSVDPTSAESIRRALRCSVGRARQLRDEWGGAR